MPRSVTGSVEIQVSVRRFDGKVMELRDNSDDQR